MSKRNEYTRLKTNVTKLLLDKAFLKKCKRRKIIPGFIKIETSLKNAVTEKVIATAQSNWLNWELKSKYANLQKLELRLYSLHLELAPALHNGDTEATYDCTWYEFLRSTSVEINGVAAKKKEKINKKFNELQLVKRTENRCQISDAIAD